MAPNPRIKQAFRTMEEIGISKEKVKPVLKKLLKLYDKNWELIESENYRVLADAIFEEDNSKVPEHEADKNSNEEDIEEEGSVPDEVVRPLKRRRLRKRMIRNHVLMEMTALMWLEPFLKSLKSRRMNYFLFLCNNSHLNVMLKI